MMNKSNYSALGTVTPAKAAVRRSGIQCHLLVQSTPNNDGATRNEQTGFPPRARGNDGFEDIGLLRQPPALEAMLKTRRRCANLDTVEILGYYLLTDELDVRRVGGIRQKKRLYGNQANKMKQAFKDKLQHLANLEVEGGAAWVLSAKPYSAYEQFALLEKELAKQLRVELC